VEKYKIITDGIITWAREIIYKRRNYESICPLCKKKIEDGDRVYMLINNYKLFPNTIIHWRCVLTKGTIFEDEDWESTIKKLMNDYNKAMKLKEEIRCWFEKEE
jgi:hypothetical protein